jgi:hypothetical protein
MAVYSFEMHFNIIFQSVHIYPLPGGFPRNGFCLYGLILRVYKTSLSFQSHWFHYPVIALPLIPLTEMSTRGIFLSGGGGELARPARKADNLTAICEPIV